MPPRQKSSPIAASDESESPIPSPFKRPKRPPGRPIRVLPKHTRVAKAFIQDGESLSAALTLGGFSPKSGKRGLKNLWKHIPALKVAMKELTPEDDRELVKFRLRLNTLRGEDRGTLSAKTLGSIKEVGMFDDNKSALSVHLNIANVPLEWRNRYHLPEGESPVIDSDETTKDAISRVAEDVP